MVYDIEADRAELALETGPRAPLVPLQLMGSGIQQIAVLCARLVMTPADIFAIEEPELNLRWSVQRALHDLLLRLGREPGGPQLLLTSHSGQFETAATCYILTRTEAGARIQKTSVQEALDYTQPELTLPPPGARAPQSYVTTEGLIQIPQDVREKLGLAHGGGVVFLEDNDGHFHMLTNDQFFDLFEKREPAS
jgi:AbrB family looped-hinge helix DNA binding protein